VKHLPDENKESAANVGSHDLALDNSPLFIVLNPVAGSCKVELVREILKYQCEERGRDYAIYETTGTEHLSSIVRQALTEGYKTVAAAGGDGTASAVASQLLQHDIPLGIIPVGTANLLARELNIPLELEAACQLVVNGGAIRKLDAMRIGEHILISHISMGAYSFIAERTSITAKRYFRQLAYIWNGLTELIGTRTWRFDLIIDGRKQRVKAAFIMIANVGAMGAYSMRWGADVKPDDGEIDICIVRAQTLSHYLSFMWHILRQRHKQFPHISYMRAKEYIKISTKKNVPVRGDGEIIGQSSAEIEIIPSAIEVIVPEEATRNLDVSG
jgi:YegS/Rv2252/BmrU family lipid kinase